MSRALLDINVLLALLDRDHVDHGRARTWLHAEIATGWSSCAITQNGFVRIVSQPRYPSPVSPSVAIRQLRAACATPHHEFWTCELSVLNGDVVDESRLHGPKQVTDAYLLSLAVRHGGRFATFDQAIALSAVRGADESHLAVLA